VPVIIDELVGRAANCRSSNPGTSFIQFFSAQKKVFLQFQCPEAYSSFILI